jgi:hypothetical protein
MKYKLRQKKSNEGFQITQKKRMLKNCETLETFFVLKVSYVCLHFNY